MKGYKPKNELAKAKISANKQAFQFNILNFNRSGISSLSLEAQGLYLSLCIMYWQNDCLLHVAEVKKKYSRNKPALKELWSCQAFTIKENKISIAFLDDQLIPKKRKTKPLVIPSKEEVRDYFKKNGYKASVALRAYEYYHINGWKDSNGKPVKSWKQKMIGVWFTPENKGLDNDNDNCQLERYQ